MSVSETGSPSSSPMVSTQRWICEAMGRPSFRPGRATGRPSHSRSAMISVRRCAFVSMWVRTSRTARSGSPE